MQQLVANDRWEVVGTIAQSLLEQGERCVEAGLLQQARALLGQAWSLAHGDDLQLADSVAWSLGWVLIHQGDYDEARSWFQRIRGAPLLSDRSWRIVAPGIEELCTMVQRVGGPLPARLPDPAPLEVISFGSFHMLRGGMNLPGCRSRRAIAILRCLLISPYRRATREELMDLLWPEARPRQAAHNLHVAVSALRSYLDDGPASAVLYESGSYRLNPAVPIVDDTAEFTRLCGEGDRHIANADRQAARRAYEQALGIYRGDYTVDASGPACLLTERDRLANRFLLTLERLGQIYADLGNCELALVSFQRLLDRDPYREDIFALLLSAYLRLGRRAEAMRHYDRFCTTLRQELGLDVAFELRQLLREM